MTPNSEDEGFEALLKPIQDLTKNWEVNLCLHLEEYLSYIRQICGDNIPDMMNFAQAAVLVQNSANIYSKKVDFLYSHAEKLLDDVKHKQYEDANRENQEGNAGQQAGRRRRQAATLETDEFVMLGMVCSDRSLTLDVEKEKNKIKKREKPKIVLNAATKAKAKDKTSCSIYNSADEIMGKKEEFRLNWRISSIGVLHVDFVMSRNTFKELNPVEISVVVNGNISVNESHYDNDNDFNHTVDMEQPPLENDRLQGESPNHGGHLASSFLSTIPIDRESEDRLGEARMRTEAAKTVDVNEIAWKANDFDVNIPEKPVKKKKVLKIPPAIEEETKKRKHQEQKIYTFCISDELLLVQYNNTSFFRDLDFCYQSKLAGKNKRQLFLQHRAKYFEYVVKQACEEAEDGFRGFYNEDVDSDNGSEFDFSGFGELPQQDDDVPEVVVPLPDNVYDPNMNEGCWRGDDVNTYDHEARKTIMAFRSRKVDHRKTTELTERVKEWHQKILPKLEEAEQRSSFDINEYGTKVIDKLDGLVGTVKTFDEVVAGEPREEVARYFLASLVLTNHYNIEITESQQGDLNIDCVVMKLLSTVRHHEELDDNLRQTSDK